MNADGLIDSLENNAEVLRAALGGVDDEVARWKPAPQIWSILEVACHLLDEEREDFRLRLDVTLHQPEGPWPEIDPEGWATARGYNEKELAPTVAAFLEERTASVAWLRELQAPDWSVGREFGWGRLTAGDLLSSWVAHDSLHLRQIARIRYRRAVELGRPYSVRYAGKW